MCKKDIQVEVVVPNQTRYLGLIGKIGEEIGKEIDHYAGDNATLAYHLNLVLTEAMVNAIKYANAGNCSKKVRVTIHIDKDELSMKVYDQGQGFDLDSVPVPDLDHPSEGGRGVFIIKTLMDSVRYRKTKGGNVLEMRKYLG